MASIEIRTVTTNSFEARVIDLPTGYAKYLNWYLDDGSEFTTGVIRDESESRWEEFTGLDPSTTYILHVTVKDLSENIVDEVQRKITTNAEEEDSYIPDVESIYIQKRDADDPATQIAVRAMGFDEEYPYNWKIYWYVYENNSQIQNDTDTVDAGDDHSETITFSGLTPDTKYIISLRIRYEVNGSYKYHYAEDIPITTKSESSSSNRPDEFTWKNGTKEKQSGKLFDITAEEWGNLLDNINAVREYKGYKKIEATTIPNQGITEFYYPEPNDPFYATNYNQCLYAFHKDIELLTMDEYAEHAVKPEYPITAAAINFLVETINSVK